MDPLGTFLLGYPLLMAIVWMVLAALFVLLHSGQQFCLRQSVQPIPLDPQALGLTLADPTP